MHDACHVQLPCYTAVGQGYYMSENLDSSGVCSMHYLVNSVWNCVHNFRNIISSLIISSEQYLNLIILKSKNEKSKTKSIKFNLC